MRCSFCGKKIPPGRGKIFVRKSGRVLNFCSLKCEKSMLELRRKPQRMKWVKKE